MAKLIDADKLLGYIEHRQKSGDGSDELYKLEGLIRLGTFDLTPVQPDIKPGDRVAKSEEIIHAPTVLVDFDNYLQPHMALARELEVIKDE